jgi:hypothetical protein
MNTNIKVLDHLVVVNLDVHIWSARKKLSPCDLGGAELPPEDLASLGSKRICNPEALRAFSTLKARAVSILERNGVRFLNGWAIPEDRLDEISKELCAVKDKFTEAREDFLRHYDNSVREWIDKHPQWASIIASSTVSEEHVRSRIKFRWQIFRIVPPMNANNSDNLHEDVKNLANTLFDEISKSAMEAWNNCYLGKMEITRKALSPLKTMYEKLTGLTFMEPRVSPVAELIKTALANIPKRGAINGGTLVMLQGLVSLLSKPNALLEHSQRILEGRQQAQDILEEFIGNAVHVSNEHATPDSGEDEQDEPVFVDVPVAPVIDSNGLW